MPAIGRLLGFGALSAALLAGPATTDAAITVGSPLTAHVNNNVQEGCGAAACSIANVALAEPGANVASPLTGVLVRWRMLGNANGEPSQARSARQVAVQVARVPEVPGARAPRPSPPGYRSRREI